MRARHVHELGEAIWVSDGLLDAFGLTPRGCRSIDAPPPPDEADEVQRFLAGSGAHHVT